MTEPTKQTVDATLHRMEQNEKWQSDAEREKKPVTNLRDSGAPLLKVDEVLRNSYPNLEGKR